MTNFEKIKTLDIEQMERFIRNIKVRTKQTVTYDKKEDYEMLCNKDWLNKENEVDND